MTGAKKELAGTYKVFIDEIFVKRIIYNIAQKVTIIKRFLSEMMHHLLVRHYVEDVIFSIIAIVYIKKISGKYLMTLDNEYQHTPLQEAVRITEHDWPEDVKPLVHIRTMTYNQERFIGKCIDGILMQKTTFPVQLLIHDDASTDKTADIVREYEGKYPKLIKAFYQEKNTYQIKRKYDEVCGSLRYSNTFF